MQLLRFGYEAEERQEKPRNPLLEIGYSSQKGDMRQFGTQKSSRRKKPFIHNLLETSLTAHVQRVLSFLINSWITQKIFNPGRSPQNGDHHKVQMVRAEKRKTMERDQEFVRVELLKDQFLSLASHELKTPMTTIIGQAQLSLRRLSRLPESSSELAVLRTALESIDGQTRRLNALVDQLLDLTTIRAGKIPLQFAQWDLVELCRTVVEEQRLLAERAIELHAPPKTIFAEVDDTQLRQVLVNLLSNALKYSSEESPVNVFIERSDRSAIIRVSDKGKGIPREHLAYIFEPFYRSPDVNEAAIGGLGLGLAISKDIVERHHGNIWCDSHESYGSTFFVELPLQQMR